MNIPELDDIVNLDTFTNTYAKIQPIEINCDFFKKYFILKHLIEILEIINFYKHNVPRLLGEFKNYLYGNNNSTCTFTKKYMRERSTVPCHLFAKTFDSMLKLSDIPLKNINVSNDDAKIQDALDLENNQIINISASFWHVDEKLDFNHVFNIIKSNDIYYLYHSYGKTLGSVLHILNKEDYTNIILSLHLPQNKSLDIINSIMPVYVRNLIYNIYFNYQMDIINLTIIKKNMPPFLIITRKDGIDVLDVININLNMDKKQINIECFENFVEIFNNNYEFLIALYNKYKNELNNSNLPEDLIAKKTLRRIGKEIHWLFKNMDYVFGSNKNEINFIYSQED